MWKTYKHEIKFTGIPLVGGNPFKAEHPLHYLYCTDCYGSGHEMAYFGPGSIMTFPIPLCKTCNGHGKPPIPPHEIGL